MLKPQLTNFQVIFVYLNHSPVKRALHLIVFYQIITLVTENNRENCTRENNYF